MSALREAKGPAAGMTLKQVHAPDQLRLRLIRCPDCGLELCLRTLSVGDWLEETVSDPDRQ